MNVTFTFTNEAVRKAYCVLTGKVITDEEIETEFGKLDPINVGDGMAELQQIAFLAAIIELISQTKKRDRAKSKFERKLEEIKENYNIKK